MPKKVQRTAMLPRVRQLVRAVSTIFPRFESALRERGVGITDRGTAPVI
jgi:hypothetical protein